MDIGTIGTVISCLLGLYLLYDKTIGAKIRKEKKIQEEKDNAAMINHLQTNDLEHIKDKMKEISDQTKLNGYEISKLWTEIKSQQKVCAERHKN